MDAPGTVPESINCHACNAPIDLSGHAGFTHVECPRCGELSVVPLKFGNFLLLSALGIGGMGTVYKAIDLSLNRYLALKILRKKLASNPEFIDNFAREARAAAAVNHPNVAQVYSFAEHNGEYYLAMELLERGSLDDRMTKLGKVPEKDVLEIGSQIAAGLRVAQQRGLLHRDIKPGNILFNEEGVPKIVDFGLARPQAEKAGESGTIWGTPYYIAPEKLRGQPEDFRSDIYSLGATLFHALAGRPPFDAKTASEVVTKHATQPAFSLKTYVPSAQALTARVIGRMLAKDPAERYESYDALIHDLHLARRNLEEIKAAPAVVTETGERFSLSSVLGSIAAVVVCVVVIWYVVKNRQKFGLESAPVEPPAPTAVVPSAPAGTPGPVAVTVAGNAVDFNEDARWVKEWSVATLQMAQGRFNDALFGYDAALYTVGRSRPKHQQWLYFYEAIALLAGDRPGEASNVLAKKARNLMAKTGIPDQVTPDNFIDPLIQCMVDDLPLADLEQAIPRLPAWAAALSHLVAGFKHLEAGQFAPAAEQFRAYHKMPVEEDQRWAFNLQPLADRLARNCDSAIKALDEIDRLEADQKYDAALQALNTAVAKTKLPALKVALATREARLQKAVDEGREKIEQAQREADAQKQARAEQERQKAEEETKQIQALDTSIAPLVDGYFFKGLLGKYEAVSPQIQTAAGKQLLAQRLATARWLTEFKTTLAGDFARRPYDSAGVQTRNSAQVAGRLSGATDTQLVFSTPYGELVIGWGDLPPVTIQKLADFYATTFAPTEKPPVQARRYLALAVFCKQYGLDRPLNAYLKQATQLDAGLQPEVDALFGPPAG